MSAEPHRVADGLAALGCLLLAVRAAAHGPLGPGMAALWGVAAVGFLTRGPVLVYPDLRAVVAGVLGLVTGAALLAAAMGQVWGPAQRGVALAALVVAAASALALRPAFALLPAVRALVQHGPYAVVRHPMYASQLVVLYVAATTLPPAVGAAGAGLATWSLTWRAVEEERLLARIPGWEAYAARVRWRLVPGVW